MNLKTPHGDLRLPAFFPDGTRGVVKTVDTVDLKNCAVPGIVMNTFHLYTNPGRSVIRQMGGLHAFIGWDRPILTDSGGFQVFSLIRENPKYGEVQRDKIVFRDEKGGKILFSPQTCIQSQAAYRADIMMCLDYCTHPEDDYERNALSVETTIRWASECREEFDRLTKNMAEKPLLFGIIQGGGYPELREKCAQALIAIGFDGFGFGGWPLNSRGELVADILEQTARLMPDHLPKYAMGLGKPEHVVACHRMGYNLFDCVLPTRDARHNRLYTFKANKRQDIVLDDSFYSNYYVLDDKHRRDERPVSQACDCHTCRNYSRGYLRHLYAVGDPLAYRLGTIHNLRFYSMLMELLGEGA